MSSDLTWRPFFFTIQFTVLFRHHKFLVWNAVFWTDFYDIITIRQVGNGNLYFGKICWVQRCYRNSQFVVNNNFFCYFPIRFNGKGLGSRVRVDIYAGFRVVFLNLVGVFHEAVPEVERVVNDGLCSMADGGGCGGVECEVAGVERWFFELNCVKSGSCCVGSCHGGVAFVAVI